MNTDRKYYVAGNQVAPAVSRVDGPNAIPYEICVRLPIDFGIVPIESHELKRPAFDGALYLGSQAKPRDFTLRFGNKLTGSYSATLAEEEKDYALGQLLKWFAPVGDPVTFMVRSESGTDRERVLTVKPTGMPSWSIDENWVGQVRDDAHFFAEVPLRAQFPWWLDSMTSGMYLSDSTTFTGTAGTLALSNNGHLDTGIQIALQGPNTITGWSVSVTYGTYAITLAATVTLSPTTWVVLDFWCSDPLSPPQLVTGVATATPFTLTGLTSIRSSVTTWPARPPLAQVGSVAVGATRTAGTGTGTVRAIVRRRWITP